MAKDVPSLTWTKKQTLVFELLSNGTKPSVIKKEHNVSYPYITLVKNAMFKGEHPLVKTTKAVNSPAKAKAGPVKPVVKAEVKTSEAVNTTDGVVKTDVAQAQQDVKTEVKPQQENTSQAQQTAQALPVPREAVAARITVQPVNIALTPTMYNVKSYLVQRLGWSQDTTWEDIIDNVFAKYFDSIGIVMRGWYEKAEFGPSKPASVNGNGQSQSTESGNVHKSGGGEEAEVNTESDAFKKLLVMVSKGIVVLAKQNKLGEL